MAPSPRVRPYGLIVAAFVLLATGVLFVAPVDATYLSRVGSDTIEYRTASCGVPVMSLLGADPGLGGGSAHPIGAEGARQACDAAAGKRVIGGLILLVVLASSARWLSRRQHAVEHQV